MDPIKLEPLALLEPPAEIRTADDLKKAVHDLFERVNVLSQRGDIAPGNPERENLERAFRDLEGQVDGLKSAMKDMNRTVPGKTDEPFTGLGAALTRLSPPKGMSRLHFNLMALSPDEISYVAPMGGRAILPGLGREAEAFSRKHGLSDSWRARLYELQALNDLILLSDLMLTGDGSTEYAMRGEGRLARIKTLKLYKEWARLAEDFKRAAGTALDTATADQGTEWVPTMWSSQLIGLIQAELVVAPLFMRTVMPAPVYKLPILGGDTIAYKAGEGLEEGATAITSLTFVTKQTTLTAVKLATRMMASSEIMEDSVINVAPLVQAQISKAIARGIDDAILNGDTTATHMDTDTEAAGATDRRTAWKGLRYYALQYTGSNIPKLDAGAASPLTFSDLMTLKKNMGAYGARPSQGVWIAGYRSIIELMLAKDENGNQVFLTLEKYGPNAIALTGELGRVAGSPAVLSEFSREDLDGTGVNGATGNTKGVIQYANREAFTLGERRAITLTRSADRYIETDQLVFVGTWRGDFQPLYAQPTEKIVGILYNVP